MQGLWAWNISCSGDLFSSNKKQNVLNGKKILEEAEAALRMWSEIRGQPAIQLASSKIPQIHKYCKREVLSGSTLCNPYNANRNSSRLDN